MNAIAENILIIRGQQTWFAKFYVNQNFKTIGAEKNLGY